jgi:hypothetical protein
MRKKIWKQIFFSSFESLKKGVGTGSGSISQMWDPDPHENVTDPRQ